MTTHIIDGDLQTLAREPSSLALVVSSVNLTETSGGYYTEPHILSEAGSHALQGAMQVAISFGNDSINRQATELVAAINAAFSAAESFGLESSHVPQLHAELPDDNSLLFEWILPNFRLGFGLEDDETQSSWFLVTNETLGSISSSGYLQVSGFNI